MAAAATPRTRHRAGLAGWILLLLAALLVATAFDDPRLATPAVTDLQAWGAWLTASDPVFVTAALVRLLLVGITWYLLGATTVLLVARLTDSLAMLRVAEALAVPLVRRVVAAGLGMGLAASMVTATSGAHGHTARARAAGGPPSAVVASTDADPPSMRRAPSAAAPAPAPAMVVRVDATDEAASPRPANGRQTTGPAMLVAPADEDADVAAPARKVGSGTWTVRSGDHLWHVADQVMTDHLGRSPTDQEIVPYWRRLVTHNRSRLPDPDNPDLVLPGLVLQLVDPSAAP